MDRPVRTRFAPSPTGFLHIGGARTALFSWAFAHRYGGTFILRIEDTDLERSTPEATQAILEGMEWLHLNYDEGPFFQSKRMDRYRAVIGQMLEEGTAYKCYCSKEELDAMRAAQEAVGQKPRYDGRWRPEVGKTLGEPPKDVRPVVRFRNPVEGEVAWTDMVKGPVSFANQELDDLIIARSDGSPTYNFCVVVDDLDMEITHVIRGDDHVNNTPRQINILRALKGTPPAYGHVPLLHGMDGQKLSKRHGAVSVIQYHHDGYLYEAVSNYLSRLGWSHGDEEIFSRCQFIEWFDTEHISKGPARFDFDKLKWVNHQYMQSMAISELIERIEPFLRSVNVRIEQVSEPMLELLRERCSTLVELAQWVARVIDRPTIDKELSDQHLTPSGLALLSELSKRLGSSTQWNRQAISLAIKELVTESNLKMPQVAMPARVALFGTAQTPSMDAMLALLTREEALARLDSVLLATG